MSNFKIGQKVVCIFSKRQFNPTLIIQGDDLVLNEIYTIKGFSTMGGLLFNEICGGYWCDGDEAGYKATRFRPLDHQFAEDLLAEITEKAMQDELVNV